MSQPISTFFDAWQLTDKAERLAKITSATTANVQYDDPQTPESLKGIDALSDYVGMFSTHAPGWTAKVVKVTVTNGMSLATVAFSGKGPDGNDKVQYGQYFVEIEGQLLSRVVGFVGAGTPE